MINPPIKTMLLLMALVFCRFSNAQVSINNTSPQGIFHVDGAKDNPGTGVPTTAQQANDFVVRTDGKVGIGTSIPQTKLDLVTAANAVGLQHTDGAIRLQTFLGRGNTNGNTDAGWLGTSTNHPLDFMTYNNFRMRITPEGNVGIGTSSPTQKLHVAGKVRIDDLPLASGTDRSVYVGADGTLSVLANSTARRSLWGVVKLFTAPNGSPAVSIENPGSGGWTLLPYITGNDTWGTAMIIATTPFASIPSVIVTQYLTAQNGITNNIYYFNTANTRDNAGVDAATRNQFQIWACDSNGTRTSDGRFLSFVINGY